MSEEYFISKTHDDGRIMFYICKSCFGCHYTQKNALNKHLKTRKHKLIFNEWYEKSKTLKEISEKQILEAKTYNEKVTDGNYML